MDHPGTFPWFDALRRIAATGCAVLVLALGAFAASPTLHAQLHSDAPDSQDAGCAVAWFAAGVSVSLPTMFSPPVVVVWSDLPAGDRAEIRLKAARHLRPPERGPPAD